ncbi:MAG: hypothetical protein POELPBGB_01928 [Bacteroidia bacterium]|nr:hypothetical protein [Bacteroidia bacterium]
MKTNNSFTAKQFFLPALLLLFLAVFTFPEFDPVIGTGLDQGYVYCFNYFFNQGISHGTDAIFSYGPLGFIRFPLLIGNNYLLTFCFTFSFQLLFVWLVFQATKHIKQKGLWLAFIAALLLSANLRIDEKMMGCVAFALVLNFTTRKNHFLFIAITVTALSFFVKLNIAAAAVMMSASYLLLDFFRNKKLNNILLTVGIGFSIYFLLWIVINHNVDGSLLHLRNWFFISNGNLGATSVNAPNDKLLLSLMLIFLAGYWYLFRSENVTTVYVVFAFALWAVFRYSIAREENHHALAFFNFLILFGGVLFLADEKLGGLRIALLIVIPYLYYQNILQTGHFHIEWKMKYEGIANFKRAVTIFRDAGEEFNRQSEQNLSNVLLADSARKIIADNTVDIFPWETSYVAANNLNYKNRPLFQLGCVNNAVLDKVNADFLHSAQAPQYYIWTKQNWWGQEMSSIDFRYILSDDGQVNFSIMNNYTQIYEDEKVRILKRTEKEKLTVEKFNHTNTINWNEWTSLPELTNGTALRMKFNIERTLVGKLKHSFYKEPEYYMLYQLENDSIKKHRLVVQNTESGIWAAPYLTQYSDSLKGEKVKAIKFVYTDRAFVYKPHFNVEWEIIELK